MIRANRFARIALRIARATKIGLLSNNIAFQKKEMLSLNSPFRNPIEIGPGYRRRINQKNSRRLWRSRRRKSSSVFAGAANFPAADFLAGKCPNLGRDSIPGEKRHMNINFALVNVQMALGQTAGCPRVNRAEKFMCSPRNTGNINFSLWLTGGLSQGCPDFQKVYVFKVYVPFSCPKHSALPENRGIIFQQRQNLPENLSSREFRTAMAHPSRFLCVKSEVQTVN